MGTRSWYAWAFAGAAAVVALELAAVGAFLGGRLFTSHPALAPSPVVIQSPNSWRGCLTIQRVRDPQAGRNPVRDRRHQGRIRLVHRRERTSGIGRRTKNGQWAHWALEPGCLSQPLAITVGPDGNVWYADMGGGAFGRITPDGSFTKFPMQPLGGPVGIAAGPDGNVWLASLSAHGPFIEKVAVDGSPLGLYQLPQNVGEVRGIVAGSDGAMWFTESAAIGRITLSGEIQQFPLPMGAGTGSPYQIAAGPDDNVWFVEYLPEGVGRVGRMTTSGKLTEFATPGNRGLQWITAGPDKAMWITGLISNTIGRISLSGSVTTYPVPTSCRSPRASPPGRTPSSGSPKTHSPATRKSRRSR